MTTKGITVLGSTGSIGQSTLDVIDRHPDRFHVVALSANGNAELLAQQCARHRARYAVISDASHADALQTALKRNGCDARVLTGQQGLMEVAGLEETDAVMAAIVGAAGLPSSLHAARSGKKLLLANKESMVIAGEILSRAAHASGTSIIPVDSEHNALFQALPDDFDRGLDECGVERLILTASGGPFLNATSAELKAVTPEQACKHPNWDMGKKISVDSATLMNKGLEVIEARWLFNAHPDQIDVVIHPQSIVHSMVSYRDGSVLAQLGMPDMRTPIAHALGWPERIESGVERLDLTRSGRLEFHQPDLDRFPCLGLAFRAMQMGGNAAVIVNAANEIAVEAFLNREIGFLAIPAVIEETLASCAWDAVETLDDVLAYDGMARETAKHVMQTYD